MTTPLATSTPTPANAGTATLVRPAHSEPDSFNTLIGDLKESQTAQDEMPVEHTGLPRQVVNKSEKSKTKPDKKDDAQPAIVAPSQAAPEDPLKRLLAFALGLPTTNIPSDTDTKDSAQTGDAPSKGDAKIAPIAPQVLAPDATGAKAASTSKAAPEAKSSAAGQLSFSARITQPAAANTDPAPKATVEASRIETAPETAAAAPKQEEHPAAVLEKTTTASIQGFTEPAAPPPHTAVPQTTTAQAIAPADRVQLAESLPVESASRDFSVKIAGPDQAQATLRIRETAGEVRVSVHTPDEALSRVLRTELDSLNTRMESSGVKAQVWAPTQSAATSDSRSHSDSQSGRSTDSQSQQSRSTSTDTDDDHQQRRSRWTEEMERQYAD